MKTRLFSPLLTALLVFFCFALLPNQAQAEVIDRGTCGDNLTWVYDDTGTLTISGSGPMYDYGFNESLFRSTAPWSVYVKHVVLSGEITSIGNYAFSFCQNLTSISLPDSLTTIGKNAFLCCRKLTDITLPNSVTVIEDGAFSNCTKLNTVNFPNGLTKIGDSAFYACFQLTTLNIADSVTSIGKSAFSSCGELSSIRLPSGLRCIEDYTFQGCSKLTRIDIPESVTSIGQNAFCSCDQLVDITIPNGVTSIGTDAFSWCAIEQIDIPNSVTEIDGAFSDCCNLKSVTFPEHITRISYGMFYGCTSLTDFTIPASVKTIEGSAFSGCKSLTKITIPDSVTSIEPRAFSGSGLTEITIPEGITIIDYDVFRSCANLTKIIIPDSVTVIGEQAFQGCSSLTSIAIPDNVTTIGDYAFNDCSSLTYVRIPDSVTSIGTGLFVRCTGLTSVSLPTNITAIHAYMFAGCTGFTEFTIPESVSVIHSGAFAECTNLATITIPDSVISIGKKAFQKCENLTSITIPEGVTTIEEYTFSDCANLTSISIPDSVTSIGASAFYGCTQLTAISIPDSVTSLGDSAFCFCYNLQTVNSLGSIDRIHQRTFYECRNLTSISIPYGVTRIDTSAFSRCSSLTSVEIPNSVTHIYSSAFSRCSSLTSVEIPNSVTHIYSSAFSHCSRLTSVTIPESVTFIDTWAFSTGNKLKEITFLGNAPTMEDQIFKDVSATVYYPANVPSWTSDVKSQYSGNLTWVAVPMLVIVEQPVNTFVNAGQIAMVSVSAVGEDLRYEWYYANRGSDTFVKTNAFHGDTYAVQMNKNRYGRRVYCVITDKNGDKRKTDTVTIGYAISITKQPIDVQAFSGEMASVSVNATGNGLCYSWYYANSGSDEFKLTTTFTSNRYTIAMNNVRNGRQVYCVITDEYGNTATTNTVTLSMKIPVNITAQPADVAAVSGTQATVTVGVQGDGLTYKWYYASKGSDTFTYTKSFTTNVYSVTMNSARNGRRIYCVITDKYGNSVTTDTVTLSMKTPLKITSQPVDAIVGPGDLAKVTVRVQGEGLTFKWYYANAGSNSYTYTKSFGGNAYSVSMTAARNGRRVYCVITDKYGDSVTTNTVTIGTMKLISQPVSVAVAEGAQAKVKVNIRGEGLTFRWYYSDGGEFKLTTAFRSNSYTVSMNEARNGRRLYCVITDQYGNSITTDTITISMK